MHLKFQFHLGYRSLTLHSLLRTFCSLKLEAAFLSGVRGCPLENGETSPSGKTVQYVFPACYGVRHTPLGLYHSFLCEHTMTPAKPKNC